MDNANYRSDGAPENSNRKPANRSGGDNFADKLKKPIVIVPLILLLALLGLYLYKESELSDVRRQAELEQATVIQRANERISENNRYFLEVLMKPFSWALRTALLSGNTEQVDQYLFQFVQEEKFSLLVVADAEGNIISSTDQNYTGASFTNHFAPEYLRVDSTVVDDSNPERMVVVTPIMGLNSKVGTLLAVYKPEQPIGQQEQQEQQPEE